MSNILVIDDDADICTLLNRYLSKNGFSVTTAYSGKAALEKIIMKALRVDREERFATAEFKS